MNKLLLYCTKAKPYLYRQDDDTFKLGNKIVDREISDYKKYYGLNNGKIVAECDFGKIEEIFCCCVPYRNNNNLGYEYFIDNGVYKVEWNKNNIENDNPEAYKEEGVVFERNDRYIDSMFKDEELKKMCLTPQQLLDYIKLGNKGYALHISNLKVFDEPKELSDYYNIAPRTMADCMNQKVLIKAPQNMCNAYDVYKNHYVLISIQAEWLCKILNGEKTIEVRKKVLKEMLENE